MTRARITLGAASAGYDRGRARLARNDGPSRRIRSESNPSSSHPKIIFFGNGPLADFTLATLKPHVNLLFHARTSADLTTVHDLKTSHPDAHGILASFGVIIKPDLLDLFEPEGILNLHPSLLPRHRGPSPIETAILNGDTTFSVSIMKLAKAMDAGPIYYQTTLTDFTPKNLSTPPSEPLEPTSTSDLTKTQIYQKIAETGSKWLLEHLDHLPIPVAQDDAQATYTRKFTPDDSLLDPKTHTARELLNHIRAHAGFPKSKITLYGHECIIHEAHISNTPPTKKQLSLICQPDPTTPRSTKSPISSSTKTTTPDTPTYLILDRLQPAGKKPMDAISFLNGYAK